MQSQLDTVRTRYAKLAGTSNASCCDDSCCSPASQHSSATTSCCSLGYDEADLAQLPEGAELSLGCGNPLAIANLSAGETVLDLGSGGGIDCFLAKRRVGPEGLVIGVDMTPEMIARARRAAETQGIKGVEFRLGQIERLPVADGAVDVVLSNCVINLSPDKGQVFREAFRVLRPGGRIAIMDILATAPMPPEVREDPELLGACIAGAATIEQTRTMLELAGFTQISIEPNEASRSFIRDWIPHSGLEASIVSCAVTARVPLDRCS